MALVMFYLAEIAEAYFGEPKREITWRPHNTMKISAAVSAGSCLRLSLFVLVNPHPWTSGICLQDQLVQRSDQPGQFMSIPEKCWKLKKNRSVAVRILDVRPEADFNIFHIAGAQRLDPARIANPAT